MREFTPKQYAKMLNDNGEFVAEGLTEDEKIALELIKHIQNLSAANAGTKCFFCHGTGWTPGFNTNCMYCHGTGGH